MMQGKRRREREANITLAVHCIGGNAVLRLWRKRQRCPSVVERPTIAQCLGRLAAGKKKSSVAIFRASPSDPPFCVQRCRFSSQSVEPSLP